MSTFPDGVLEALSAAWRGNFRAELTDCTERREWPLTFIHELLPLRQLRSLKSTSTTQCRVVGTKGLAGFGGMDRYTAAAQLRDWLLQTGPVLPDRPFSPIFRELKCLITLRRKNREGHPVSPLCLTVFLIMTRPKRLLRLHAHQMIHVSADGRPSHPNTHGKESLSQHRLSLMEQMNGHRHQITEPFPLRVCLHQKAEKLKQLIPCPSRTTTALSPNSTSPLQYETIY
jgi:hypothetical protein